LRKPPASRQGEANERKLDGILNKWREEREEKEVVVTADDMMHIISKSQAFLSSGWNRRKHKNSS